MDLEIDELIEEHGLSSVLQMLLDRIRVLERRVEELEDYDLGA